MQVQLRFRIIQKGRELRILARGAQATIRSKLETEGTADEKWVPNEESRTHWSLLGHRAGVWSGDGRMIRRMWSEWGAQVRGQDVGGVIQEISRGQSDSWGG